MGVSPKPGLPNEILLKNRKEKEEGEGKGETKGEREKGRGRRKGRERRKALMEEGMTSKWSPKIFKYPVSHLCLDCAAHF